MLFSTPHVSSYHSVAEHPIHLSVGDKTLEHVHSIKLLGVHMNLAGLGGLGWCPSSIGKNQELRKLQS